MMLIHERKTGSRQAIYAHYALIPALRGARFAFIEEPLWAAGLKWAKLRGYRSKPDYDLNVLFGVTRLVLIGAVVIRETTDKSIVLTATTKYLRSVGKTRGNLMKLSMSDIRRAEKTLEERRNVRRR